MEYRKGFFSFYLVKQQKLSNVSHCSVYAPQNRKIKNTLFFPGDKKPSTQIRESIVFCTQIPDTK